MTFDPHSHPHAHPVERRLQTVDAGIDSGHARAHSDVWLADVSVGYGDRPALENVNLAVEAGSLLAVVGPNGAGKSTLLKLMAGLLRPWHGRVEVLGHPAGQQARRVAYVPQAELVDWGFPVTVSDVVMMGRYPALGRFRRPGPDDRRAVDAALEQVGMADHASIQIGSLSGGQRRRVFLARALAAGPDLFLLDEPVTGVDATTQEDLDGHPRGRGPERPHGRRDDPRPGMRRAAVPAGRDGQPDDHRPRTVVADPRSRRPRPDLRRALARARRPDGRARRRPPPRRRAGRRTPLPRGRARRLWRQWRQRPSRSPRAMIDLLAEPIGHAFFVRALVAAMLVGTVCAVVGTFVVLKGLAFIGDAISHAAFPGVVAAYILQGPILVGAAIAAVLTALSIGFVTRRAGIRGDTAIGVLFAGAFALGVFMFSTIDGYVGDLFGFLFGSLLLTDIDDLIGLAILAALVLVTVALLWKELLYATFDPQGAAASGSGSRASSTCSSRSWR